MGNELITEKKMTTRELADYLGTFIKGWLFFCENYDVYVKYFKKLFTYIYIYTIIIINY